VIQKAPTSRSTGQPPRAWTGTLPKSLNVNGGPPTQKPTEDRQIDDSVPRQIPPNAWQHRSNVMPPPSFIPRRPSLSSGHRPPTLSQPLNQAESQGPNSTVLEPALSPSIHSRQASISTVHSIVDQAPREAPMNDANVLIDSEEVVKATMLNAAERAKKRRMEEEADREAQKERARKKALELEVKLAAADIEKVNVTEQITVSTGSMVSTMNYLTIHVSFLFSPDERILLLEEAHHLALQRVLVEAVSPLHKLQSTLNLVSFLNASPLHLYQVLQPIKWVPGGALCSPRRKNNPRRN
jgi:hypothetical protein